MSLPFSCEEMAEVMESELDVVPETQLELLDAPPASLRKAIESKFKIEDEASQILFLLREQCVHGMEDFRKIPLDDAKLKADYGINAAMHRAKIMELIKECQGDKP
jgi:hypothetical protein